jgi:pyruvate formate-lyase activating enzyme-like uncharacterized protein
MNKQQIDSQKKQVANNIGWAYKSIRWFSSEEANEAAQKRASILASLSGRVNQTAQITKLYTGKLSPGCQICVDGHWGCCFIGFSCTRVCFFCPNQNSDRKERPPILHGLSIQSPKEHVETIERLGIKGTAFSGGEPLLYLDRVLNHTRLIRQVFGNDIYIWLYSNGDLATEDRLRSLKEAGVNEIRFDLSARNYDLSPLILARKIMPTVSVEIPAIPEDEKIVLSLLPDLMTIGIDHLNLHQLYANEINFANLLKRDYHFIHDIPSPVYESEISALRILKHVLDKDLKISTNYCSRIYKYHFQRKGMYKQSLHSFPKLEPTVSPLGYIRLLNVKGKEKDIADLVKKLTFDKTDLWSVDELGHEVWLSTHLWNYIDWDLLSVRLFYFLPKMKFVVKEDENIIQLIHQSSDLLAFQSKKLPFYVFKHWFDRYVKNTIGDRQLKKEFVQNYPIRNKQDIDEMLYHQDVLLQIISTLEEIPQGLQEIL